MEVHRRNEKKVLRMLVRKTLKLPVGELTKAKLDMLDRLTARLTYAIQLWLDAIRREQTTSRSRIEQHRKDIQAGTGLSAAFAQATRDRALWMWRSYQRLHREWGWRVKKLEHQLAQTRDPKIKRKLEHKLYRLKRREPSEPTITRKQPIMFDQRIGRIEFSRKAKHFGLWARVSKLKLREVFELPLRSYPYADKHLHSKDWSIKSSQLVRNYWLKRWEVHVVIEREFAPRAHRSIVGVDLGMRKLETAVRIDAGGIRDSICVEKEKHKWFFRRMHELNNRAVKLQRLEKWDALKRLRNHRRNLAEDFRRKLACEFVSGLKKSDLVAIGIPERIRDELGYKSNGGRVQRKRLNRWSFKRQARWIRNKALERGIAAVELNERGTTHSCCICGSRMAELEDRMLRCTFCGLEIDRDEHGAINIALRALNQGALQGLGAVVNPPELWMSWPQKPASAEAPHFSAG
jgi:putative transposase